jgi:hypothetical protein
MFKLSFGRVRGPAFTGLLALAGCAAQVGSERSGEPQAISAELDAVGGHGSPEPPMLGVHVARGQAKPSGGGGSPNMTWHNGAIMNDVAVTSIFWGKSWASSSFIGDKMTGLDSFYTGYNGSHYAGTCTEYTGTNGSVGTSVTNDGQLVDTTAAPSRPPQTTSSILTEVCNALSDAGRSPAANGYYAVYTDTPRGSGRYCAWHSYGTCPDVNNNNASVPVQFGMFLKLDGDSGCDPQDTGTTHSQGLAALANVSAHELAETMTDPRNGGWYDGSGNENGDKCAWTFNVPHVTFSNSDIWKVQGEWSNAAYTAKTGYPNGSGQGGCLDGQ